MGVALRAVLYSTVGMNEKKRTVHIATVTKHHKGRTYVTHLLRHSYREDGKVKHLTVVATHGSPTGSWMGVAS